MCFRPKLISDGILKASALLAPQNEKGRHKCSVCSHVTETELFFHLLLNKTSKLCLLLLNGIHLFWKECFCWEGSAMSVSIKNIFFNLICIELCLIICCIICNFTWVTVAGVVASGMYIDFVYPNLISCLKYVTERCKS